MMDLEYNGKPKFNRKPRNLTPIVSGVGLRSEIPEQEEDTTKKLQERFINVMLKGLHILDIAKDKAKESFIPVIESRQDVKEAVRVLDPTSDNGTKIWFSFYESLLKEYHGNMVEAVFTSVNDEDPAYTYIKTIAKKGGVDPVLLNLLSTGSNILFVYLLHKVLLAFLPSDIAQGTLTPNAAGLTMQQVIGSAALAAIGAFNDELHDFFDKKYGDIIKESLKKRGDDITDPTLKAIKVLADDNRERLIMDYVEWYLTTHWEPQYYNWVIYKESFQNTHLLYKRGLLRGIDFPVEFNKYYKDIKDHYRGISTNKFVKTDFQALDYHEKTYDNYAKALSEYPMVANEICCLFKFFIKLDTDTLKLFRRVLSTTKLKLRSKMVLTDVDLKETFRDETVAIVNDIADDLIDKLLDAYYRGRDTTLGCFSVRFFLDLMIDFINELRNQAVMELESVMDLVFSWSVSSESVYKITMDSKLIDKIISILDFLITYSDQCEYYDPDSSDNVYHVNRLISEYFNKDVKPFKRPDWETNDNIPATPENSYIEPIEVEYNGRKIKLNTDFGIERITDETYQSCDEALYNFDLNNML